MKMISAIILATIPEIYSYNVTRCIYIVGRWRGMGAIL